MAVPEQAAKGNHGCKTCSRKEKKCYLGLPPSPIAATDADPGCGDANDGGG